MVQTFPLCLTPALTDHPNNNNNRCINNYRGSVRQWAHQNIICNQIKEKIFQVKITELSEFIYVCKFGIIPIHYLQLKLFHVQVTSL